MSELFTQTDKQKKLFRTEENIVANIQTQFGMPHTGKDLLLDAKMGPNKDQSSRLDSEPDALSDTGMSDDVGAGDTSGILHDSAGGNKNTITGTNTPRSSRTSAYYDLLRSQHKNGHYKAPAYRVVDAIESPLQAGAGALNYHDDFDTDAVQNAGLHIAVAQTVVEGNIMAAAADSAFVIGKQTGNILKDLKDETINAKDALKAGGKVLRLQGGKSVVKIGDATLRSTEQYLSSFQVSTDDFTGSVPGKVKEAATNTGNILKKITNVVLHPLRNLIAMGKVILIGAVILLFLIIVSLLGQMSGTTSTSVFCANRIEDIQTLVQKINDYRNYTCGLRVSEALHLKVADVDLDAGVLAIYGAKGDKERLVGISDSMLTCMKSYRSNPLVANAKSIYFFPAPDGGFYDTSTIYDIFRKCLFDAGIPHRGRGKGPRLHDLRHSFAVHILNKWSSEGKDIYTCLPILRTALGHDRITTTEKYLRLVPEAYMEVTEPFNERFHTITEVLCNEE